MNVNLKPQKSHLNDQRQQLQACRVETHIKRIQKMHTLERAKPVRCCTGHKKCAARIEILGKNHWHLIKFRHRPDLRVVVCQPMIPHATHRLEHHGRRERVDGEARFVPLDVLVHVAGGQAKFFEATFAYSART